MNGLHFSISNGPDAVKFELAGRLGGVDVETLHQAWQQEAFTDALKSVIVDITLITEADQHGRALLIVMQTFGARIVAKPSESYAIAQPIVAEPVESATPRPGWFGGLSGFFRKDRHTAVTSPPEAELILHISARQNSKFAIASEEA